MLANIQLSPTNPLPEILAAGTPRSFLQGSIHPFPGNASIIQYFRTALEEKRILPQNVALHFQDHQITFEQLDQLSSKMAKVLRKELRPDFTNQNPDGDLVFGVCAQPSDRLVVLLFAIMKLGGAYVPFDVCFPEERVIRIVHGAKPVVVIVDGNESTLSKFVPVKLKTHVVTLDEVWTAAEEMEDLMSTRTELLEGNSVVSERTGVILFTSGSSGEPKGVRLMHRTIMNRLNWEWQLIPLQPDDNCCWKTVLTFLDSISEIFGPLLQGQKVVVFSKKRITDTFLFAQQVERHKITRLMLVPSLLQSILTLKDVMEEGDSNRTMLNSVKLWMCGGEQLPQELLVHFFEKFPNGATICNFYGCTELMDVSWETFENVADIGRKCRDGNVPIGQPLFNSIVYILDPKLEPMPEGEVGEIYVTGFNLATGYVGVANSDKFIDNPHSKTKGFDKLYRTGDFGHIGTMTTGERTLFYNGRIDSQIKVRGHKVDLSGVNATVNALIEIKKAVVLGYRIGYPDQQIVAFVVPQNGLTGDQIKFLLKSKLLPYQMPKVKILDEIPVLVNGKSDRQRLLREYHEDLMNRDKFDAWTSLDVPRETLAKLKVLVETIARVTGTSICDIVQGLDDSFYDLGGTSLNSVAVIATLRKQSCFISIHDFVMAKSIRELSQLIKFGKETKFVIAENAAKNTLVAEILNDSHKDEVISILSSSFAMKGDLKSYLNVEIVEYVAFMESIWQQIVETGCSFAIRRISDMRIVAAEINYDAFDKPDNLFMSPGISIIVEFVDSCEAPELNKLQKGKGNILYSFMLGTHEDLTPAENVFVAEFIEEETLKFAKRNGFQGLFTTNTSKLTQQMAKDILGYTIMSEVQINQFATFDGKRPFEAAPDSQIVTVCWKRT